MARPPGKTFPVPVMVKTTEAMKARLEALAARVPFDVSVGFSVVARRAIAIGLEVLERDPRLIVEPTEGDAAAALAVLSKRAPRVEAPVERSIARFEAMATGAYDVIPALRPHEEPFAGHPMGEVAGDGEALPRGAQEGARPPIFQRVLARQAEHIAAGLDPAEAATQAALDVISPSKGES